MTDTALEAPVPANDQAEPAGAAKPRKQPNRSKRYKVFDDEQGDYRIYQVTTGPTASPVPKGSFLPIPASPGFNSATEAKKFLRGSGDKFAGMQLVILRVHELVSIQIEREPRAVMNFKPKKPVDRKPPDKVAAAEKAQQPTA